MKKKLLVPKEARKTLVKDIESFAGVGIKAKYLGAPSMAYQIGEFLVDRNCTIECGDPAALNAMIDSLETLGYISDNAVDAVIFSIPADKVNAGNLVSLLAAKDNLIMKALGTDTIDVQITEDRVCFPWFKEVKAPEVMKAYEHFISALCRLSMEQNRVSAKEKEVENEKYAFRCFLLRLGFIGDEFKEDRKILLANLEGSSAWKNVKEV